MKTSLSVPLMEQEQLQELLQILEDNGMKEEKKQVMGLAQYLDTMDEQLGAVLTELKEVKEQLGEIKDSGIKAAALRVVTRVEGKMQEAKSQVHAIKEKFMEGVKKTVETFHQKGVLALAKTVDFLGIQKGIQKIHAHLEQSILAADRGMDRLGNIADEMHEAKTHMGNIGRELAGKEWKKTTVRDVEKGPVFQMQKTLFHAMGVMNEMKQRTETALQRVEGLSVKAGSLKKPSIRESLKSLKNEEKESKQEAIEPMQLPDASISFYAAECMEFTGYGKLAENLTLPEAVKAYRSIVKKGTSNGPGIGFVLQDKNQPDYSDTHWPLFQGGKIAQEEINLIPAYREHPLVQQAAQELKQYLPHLEKGGKQKHPAR